MNESEAHLALTPCVTFCGEVGQRTTCASRRVQSKPVSLLVIERLSVSRMDPLTLHDLPPESEVSRTRGIGNVDGFL